MAFDQAKGMVEVPANRKFVVATVPEQCLEPVDRLGEGVPSRVIKSEVTE